MKNKKINFIKLGILLFGISCLLLNCNEDSSLTLKSKENLATINRQEALLFLKKNYSHKSNRKNYFIKQIFFKDTKLKNITNTKAKLTLIPITTNYENLLSKIILIKINDSIKSTILNFRSNSKVNTQYFSGQILISDLEGNFLSAFKVHNGNIIKKYERNNNNLNYMNRYDDGAECRSFCGHSKDDTICICNMQTLEEVVVNSSNNNIRYVGLAELYGAGMGEGSSGYNQTDAGASHTVDIDVIDKCDSSSGKIFNTTTNQCECPENKIENSEGICIENPCKKIKAQITNTAFSGKMKELNKLTNKKEETGYAQNKNGTFTKLPFSK